MLLRKVSQVKAVATPFHLSLSLSADALVFLPVEDILGLYKKVMHVALLERDKNDGPACVIFLLNNSCLKY